MVALVPYGNRAIAQRHPNLYRAARYGGVITPTNIRRAYNASKSLYGMYKRRSAKTRSSAKSYVALTHHRDHNISYRRRRAPRAVKRRLRRMTRNYRYQVLKHKPLQFIHRTNSSGNSSAVDSQTTLEFSIYGCNGTAAIHDDVEWISQKYYNSVALNNKVLMQSCTAEISITNSATPDTEYGGTIIVNAYEWVLKRDVKMAEYTSILGLINDGFTKQPNMAGAATGLAMTTYGLSPFSCKLFCQFFTITRIRQFALNPGETTQMAIKDPKNHYVDLTKHQELTFKKGLSRGVFFTHRGVGVGTSSNCDIRWTKEYKFTVITPTESADAAT